MTDAKVSLGRRLFYDKRMSVNGTQSCASCHVQTLAFTDGKGRAVGATGQTHSRGSMSLVNVAYDSVLTWNNPFAKSLEEQLLTPMFGDRPVELGFTKGKDEFSSVLRADARYPMLFGEAFPGEPQPITLGNIARAIACFERSIISADSPWDRYHSGGDTSAVSDSAKRGETLFFSDRLSCSRCHSGFNFSDNTTSAADDVRPAQFHNTGQYDILSRLNYPSENFGIYDYTKKPEDAGKFRAPTLRNIAITGPYMHNGTLATLDAVLDHYAAGGKGLGNRNKDPLIRGFTLTPAERADLIAFLASLTDQSVLRDKRFSNPEE